MCILLPFRTRCTRAATSRVNCFFSLGRASARRLQLHVAPPSVTVTPPFRQHVFVGVERGWNTWYLECVGRTLSITAH